MIGLLVVIVFIMGYLLSDSINGLKDDVTKKYIKTLEVESRIAKIEKKIYGNSNDSAVYSMTYGTDAAVSKTKLRPDLSDRAIDSLKRKLKKNASTANKTSQVQMQNQSQKSLEKMHKELKQSGKDLMKTISNSSSSESLSAKSEKMIRTKLPTENTLTETDI